MTAMENELRNPEAEAIIIKAVFKTIAEKGLISATVAKKSTAVARKILGAKVILT